MTQLSSASYTVLPFPRTRRLIEDGGRLGCRKHTVHGLVEFDVTRPRRLISEHKRRTGETISFTAFVANCLGQAVAANRHMHLYRSWRGQLYAFEDVDVSTLFAVQVAGREVIRPRILRAANRKAVRELHEEIRAFQASHDSSREAKLIDRFVLLPGPIRRVLYWAIFNNPPLLKAYFGTVCLTAIGMFGSGGSWGVPVPNHTLQLTLGGIGQKPGIIHDRIEIREYLGVTVSVDHDLVDGAPAARFIQHLGDLIESGHGLLEAGCCMA
jgi:pyruvate/2-oxoglutarate dehydrogenase complex dihydrolipoamide acyltransferase (E2) component